MMTLTFAGSGYAVYPPGATFGPRQNVNFEWVWIIEGEVQWVCDGQRHAAPPGTLILVPRGSQDHFIWDPQQQTRHAFLHFDYRGQPASAGLPLPWPQVRHLPVHDIARPLLQHLIHLTLQATPPPAAQMQAAGQLLLQAFCSGHLESASPQPAHLPPPIERAFAWIAQRWERQPLAAISLGELARAAGVSEVHLCRLFRHRFGLRPGQVVRLNRLHHGAVLLAHSNLGIKEVAALTGFATSFHFSRCFHTTYGLAPRDYRAQVLAGQPVPLPYAPVIDRRLPR